MEPAQLGAFVVFSLVGSFTPGPNNTIATATAANFGFRAALPHIFGVPFGFSTMLALGSLGAVGLLLSLPTAAGAIKWAGIAYLVYLGWLLIRAARPRPDHAPGTLAARPLTFLESALFQYANPKAWMLATATAGTFMSGRDVATRAALICMVFQCHVHREPRGMGVDGRRAAPVVAHGAAAVVVQRGDGALAGRDRALDGGDDLSELLDTLLRALLWIDL
jgi:threonine/homoserine/homoserine lactone efflux protein